MSDKPPKMMSKAELLMALEIKKDECKRLRAWVDDLHSGMYVNCVYCGHRYGPDDETPVSMADTLKEHIKVCSEHPMSKLRGLIRVAFDEGWTSRGSACYPTPMDFEEQCALDRVNKMVAEALNEHAS